MPDTTRPRFFEAAVTVQMDGGATRTENFLCTDLEDAKSFMASKYGRPITDASIVKEIYFPPYSTGTAFRNLRRLF